VLLELENLDLKVVDDVVSGCEGYSTVLYLLRTLNLQVLHGLVLLKLTGLNLGRLLNRLQKDMVPK
jgi:hypothetical protein